MNDERNEEEELDSMTPPDLRDAAQNVAKDLLPTKSKKIYELAYKNFNKWKTEHKTKSSSQNVLISYFNELSRKYKSSSMWSTYSMLKNMINLNEGIDISKYPQLIALLKKNAVGFQSKKSNVLMPHHINSFLQNAPDDQYLAMKVKLISTITKHEITTYVHIFKYFLYISGRFNIRFVWGMP